MKVFPSSIATQQEPLPHGARDVEAAKPVEPEKKIGYMNLPNKGQLALLCIARMADPLAATSIQVYFTFILHISHSDIERQTYMFYQLKFFNPAISDQLLSTQAGIIVGAKTAAQVCTGMLWGRLADSEWGGRKIVLMIGILSSGKLHRSSNILSIDRAIGLACIGYGFSKTFVSAVAWQVFGGAMSSNVAITRCVVAELNPEKRYVLANFAVEEAKHAKFPSYRTRALLLLPLFANAGMLIGPLVGGLLSSQNKHGILKSYPYAPPNIFIATVYAVAALGIAFGLKETHEHLQHTEGSHLQRIWNRIVLRKRFDEHLYAPVGSDAPESPLRELSASTPTFATLRGPPPRKASLPFRRIWTRNVLCTMLAHFIIAGHLGTFTNLWAIFLSTPVGGPNPAHPSSPIHFSGGLGLQPREVGFAMSAVGVLGVTLQLVIYPILNDRFGTIHIWQAALFIFPLVYTLAPFPALIASNSTSTPLIWTTLLLVLLFFIIGRTGVTPATTLLINDCTPHPSVRGTIHTAGTVIGNLSRSLFPIAAFAIFGQGLKIGIVGLGFWCVAGLAVLACVASRWVVEGSNGKEIVLEGEVPPSEPQAQIEGPGTKRK